MATLTVRNLDDGAYERLKDRARSHNRSLEAEVRDLLEDQARDFSLVVDDLLAFHAEMTAKHGVLPDSISTIQDMRAT